jgi:hypothetical protein
LEQSNGIGSHNRLEDSLSLEERQEVHVGVFL